MNERMKRLAGYMEQEKLDAVLITLPKHIYYFTGFSSDPHERFLGLIMVRREEPFLLVPALDLEAAQAESAVSRIYAHIDTENPYDVLKRLLSRSAKRIGVEKNHLTMKRFEELDEAIKPHAVIDVEKQLAGMRAIKSDDEVSRIRNAVRLVEQVMHEGLKRVKPGVKEMEIAAELEYLMRHKGAAPAFPTTVLSGERTALPHGASGHRAVQQGDLLLIDMGVAADGYLSDITRTFAIGHITEKQREIYETVLEANLRAIAAVKSNAPMADIDRAARQCIADCGYGPYFTHRVGHGLGIEIHEYPSVHGENNDLLLDGMVITIEPGIYLPGLGGVRIEDDIVVTSAGADVLTTYPKQLAIIG